MHSIQWHYSAETQSCINKRNYPFLAICGPSGAGKTFLASYIESNYPDFCIIRNHTTRPARPSDSINQFEYVDSEKFLKMNKEGLFFMSRMGEYPWYGYTNKDLMNIIKDGKIPVFMFRQSGTELISQLVHNCYLIIVEADAYKSSANSKDAIHKATATNHVDCYANIKHIAQSVPSDHVLELYNDYSGSILENDDLVSFLGSIIINRQNIQE